MAADLIRLLGDPWVDDLDLDRLERLPTEYVSNDLRNRRADLPWWAPFKPGTGRPAGAGAWCGGTLSPRLGGRMPALANDKETTMLAETLREWDEQKIAEGRRAGRLAGRQEGRREVLAEERVLLCSQAARRFGAATGAELGVILAGVEDASELARVGTLIIDCVSGVDFLARARRR